MGLLTGVRRQQHGQEDVLAHQLERLLEGHFDVDIAAHSRLRAVVGELALRLRESGHTDTMHRSNLHEASLVCHQIMALQHHSATAASVSQSLSAESQARLTAMTDTLREAQASLASAVVQSHGQLSKVRENLDTIGDRMAAKLSSVEEAIAHKAASAHVALSTIEEIGNGLKVLSINARIEAARAGEAGLGFTVVAKEVGNLANEAMQKTQAVEKTIDFQGVHETMSASQHSNAELMRNLSTLVNQVMEGMQSLVLELQSQLKELGDASTVLAETALLSHNTMERVIDKTNWAATLTSTLRSVQAQAVARPSAEVQTTMRSVLKQHRSDTGESFDRLDEILESGRIVVAIEPNFVGLSFRMDGTGDLQGLDVDYAHALADWLGVACEFMETPWDTITETLYIPDKDGDRCADIVLSALPPSDTYFDLAYSETYTALEWVLARRSGDQDINELADLDGKVLGIINDPGAFDVLRSCGVSWSGEARRDIHLANLIAYTDQSKIHDALADGIVDAFAVDLPIYYWACNDPRSRWYGKIEILPGNIPDDPYYYTIAVAKHHASYRLLKRVNEFIAWYLPRSERRDIEMRWQGSVVPSELSFRDEPGNLSGEEDLQRLYEEHRTVQVRLGGAEVV